MFLDLHGHSTKKGCFMFGYDRNDIGGGIMEYAQVRLLP